MENSVVQGATSLDGIADSPVSDIVVNSVSTNAAAHTPPSMFDLFWNAGPMIKFVILVLLISSVWSWTIILSKHFRLKKLSLNADDFEDDFWSGGSLDKLYAELRNSMELLHLFQIFCLNIL